MADSEAAGVKKSRPMRADAQRNRTAILEAARETFENEGVLASLDGIALRAGVGNATLYRNFPTRDDLLAAVIEISNDEALAGAAELSRSFGPREALSEWLVRLTWQLRIWHDLPYCVATARNDPASSMTSATNPLLVQTSELLDRARESGDVVESTTAGELFQLILTLSWGVDRFGDDEQVARRRVMVATAGIFVPRDHRSAGRRT